MKRIIGIITLLLALGASSAWAETKHVVEKGEYLSLIGQKYGISWQSIQVANGIKNPDLIFPGQQLLIPGKGTMVVKKVVNNKPRKKATITTTSGRIWKNVGGNKYKGTAEWAIKHFQIPEAVKAQVLTNIRNEKFDWTTVRSGQHIEAVTFGRNRIWTNVTTQWDPTRRHAAKDYGVGEYVVARVLTCGNWVWWKKEVPPPIQSKVIPPVARVIPPVAAPPPIFREIKEQKKCAFCEHELDGGMGVWTNKEHDAQGLWWYAQYLLTLQRCGKGNIDIFGGTLVPKVGIFAKGDLGETDSGYNWHASGVGPEAGFIWTGLTDQGYPHQVQFMFRTLWEHLHGQNGMYDKKEDHFLLGYYAEYLRRHAPDLMSVLYAEGYFDVSGSIDSTWSGDEVSDRGNFSVGYKIHKDLTDHWAGRAGVQVGFAPHEERWGLTPSVELRFDEWLMFGFSLDYTLASAIEGAAGGFSYGPFIRFELKKIIQKEWTETRMEQVQPADVQLLEY